MTVAEYLTACGGLVTPPGVPAINGLPTAATLGLTMRDYFAAAALTGLLACDTTVAASVSLAFVAADAMLAERKKIVD